MRRDDPSKVVLVCSWRGRSDRFFGKYKVLGTTTWRRIPGGVFHQAFDTKEKALAFARDWYTQYKLEHESGTAVGDASGEPTWDQICDAYLAEVDGRMRGKPATRHEAATVVNANIRKGLLAVGRPIENDEVRCLKWLRAIATESISKNGAPRKRKPKTIRNITKHLRYVFQFATRRKLIAGLTVSPTAGEEFQAELKAIMNADLPREFFLPTDEFMKLVTCNDVPTERRIAYLTLGLSGMRPGELAGLQLKHVRREGEVRYFSIEQQVTEKRPKGKGGGLDTLKTKWSRRNIPIHRALVDALDDWIDFGWQRWVGRAPQEDDFVFPGPNGLAHRAHDADPFRDDLAKAGCSTTFKGEMLKPYALRHLFSTLLTEGHAHDAAHDRLMGHRPKDTKTLNYSVKQLPFLAAELDRIAFDLPEDAPTFGAEEAPDIGVSQSIKPYAA